MEGIGEGIVYKNEIFKKMLSIIPTEGLEFCCTGQTLSVIHSANLLKLLIFIKKFSYHYEYSRHTLRKKCGKSNYWVVPEVFADFFIQFKYKE